MATDQNNQDGQPLVDSPTIPEPLASLPFRKRAMSFFKDDNKLLVPGQTLVHGTNSTINNNNTYPHFGICELPATTNNTPEPVTAYTIESESESDSDVGSGISISSASSIAESYDEKIKDWQQKPSRWKRYCEPFNRLSGRQRIFLQLLVVATLLTVAVTIGLALTCASKGKPVV